jgi:peptide subunit release factor 1 (eRF1)
MLNENVLSELISYQTQDNVLSVYLNVEPAVGSADAYKLRLRQMLKEFELSAPQDTDAIERFIEHEYDWSGRSLAIFSNAADGFFRSFSLSIPLRDRARLLHRPYVKPLADLLDNFGHVGVAVVDQQGARFFNFHLGTLQEQEGTLGEDVRQIKHGRGSQFGGRRGGKTGQTLTNEGVAENNFREAAEFGDHFFKENSIRRILIGGTEENAAHFLDHLPKAWLSLLLGTFAIDMTASHTQILDKVLSLVQTAEREREIALVDAVITASAKGREGSIGLEETLAAVHDGRVKMLILHEGYRASGFRCTGCGFVTSIENKSCAFCGEPFETIEDAVELAVRRTLTDGADVQVVHENRRFEDAGRIGALLRY